MMARPAMREHLKRCWAGNCSREQRDTYEAAPHIGKWASLWLK